MKKQKNSVSAQITEVLAKKIILGIFPPGELLPGENELAKQLESSRTSVRSALQTLAAKGMISIQPKRGSEVNCTEQWSWLDREVLGWITRVENNKAILNHLMVTRLIFEPNIAALAAQNASAKDLAQLEIGYEIMLKGSRENSKEIFNQGDIHFHKAVIKASHNPFLITLGDALTAALALSFQETLEHDLSLSQPALEEHWQVMEAIRLRHIDVAREKMRNMVLSAINKVSDAPPAFISYIL